MGLGLERSAEVIPIRNVYYMLAYAFQALRERGYRSLGTEKFDNVAELCAAILARGLAAQIRGGLVRGYVDRRAELADIRGKIDVSASLMSGGLIKRRLVCEYDEFTEDTYLNRIIKSTCLKLMHLDISNERRRELRRLLSYMCEVGMLDLSSVNWRLPNDRYSHASQMLAAVCKLVVLGLLPSQYDTGVKMADFDDDNMSRLYEKFVLKYYKCEFPELNARSALIPWARDEGGDFLPVMHSDITLTHEGRMLIIDAKYYSHSMRERFGRRTVNSNNLYQIFAYVKNAAAAFDGDVSGMLLYAKTDEDETPCGNSIISGSAINVRTLDLNCDFEEISKQLDAIVSEAFGVDKKNKYSVVDE